MSVKLFAIYIGGEHPRANIEVHDIRFVAAPSIAETHEALRRDWWGRPGSLHIDCWCELSHADGYDISLRTEPFAGLEKLFYVNLGGYDAAEFTERHRNAFVVAGSVAQARSRALTQARDWDAPHRDDLYEAEQAFDLDAAAGRLHIHLTPGGRAGNPPFTCAYTPLRQASPRSAAAVNGRSRAVEP